jgi:hypothetical protein
MPEDRFVYIEREEAVLSDERSSIPQTNPTIEETFSTFNIHGAPPDFLAKLNTFSSPLLRAIYLACMPIPENTFDRSDEAHLWSDAKNIVNCCPVLKTTLAEMALLVLARRVFSLPGF